MVFSTIPGLLIFTLLFIILFHILVILRIVPYAYIWGGRITTPKQMYVFESISIVINVLLLAFMVLYAGYLPWSLSESAKTLGLGIIGLLFLLNTFGNLVSTNATEKIIFTPITLLISVLCFVELFINQVR